MVDLTLQLVQLVSMSFKYSSIFLLLRVPTWGLTSPGDLLRRRRLEGRSLQCASLEHLAGGASLRCSGL